MANYTRSRARFDRGAPDGYGGSYQRDGGRRYLAYVVAALIVIALTVGIVLIANSCSAETGALPDESPSDTVSAEYTPDATPDPTDGLGTALPTGTADSQESATPDPGASATTPSDTETPAPDDTTEPDATTTPDPTEPADTGGSSNGSDFTAETITGKADVDEYLTLRKSASASADKVAEIPKDEEFTVVQVSTNKAWLKVKYSDKTGYVLAKYVKVGSDDGNKVCTVTSDSVNVRSGAGKTKTIIGTLKQGDTVIVTDTVSKSDGKWYKVASGDSTGYVFAQYCRLAS